MTHEELNALLIRAEEAQNIGNYNEADKLAQQVLDILLIGDMDDRDGNLLRASTTNLLGVIAYRRSNYSIALEFFTAALNISNVLFDKEGIAKALGNIGAVHKDLSEYLLALDYYAKAIAVDEELGNKSGVARHLGNIGIIYTSLSDYTLALDYYAKALTAHEELGNKTSAARVTGNIGNVYYILGNYPSALEYGTKALEEHEKLGNQASVARLTGNIGLVHWNLGNHSCALEFFDKALTLHEKLGSRIDVAAVTGYIGNVYLALGDYSGAIEYFEKAHVAHKNLGDKAGAARLSGNIGLVHLNLGNQSIALEYLTEALSTLEELGMRGDAARVLGEIGNLHLSLSNYSSALEYFSKAQSELESLGMRADVARTIGSIGSVYASIDFDGYEPEKAEEMLLRALAMNEEVGAIHHIYGSHKLLSELYKQTERWKESREHFEKYHTLYLEVQSEEATKQAQLMEHRRKIEESERDRQIKLARFQEQEKILHNILPAQIAERMVAGEKMIADSHDHVSVFFSDIVGFTKLSQQVTAKELVGMLNGIFSQFDQLARKHGLEKIKTIGDSYMAVAGAPIPQDNHAERAVLFSLEVAEFMENYRTDSGDKVDLRIGLHTGSVVAGVIGENKFSYDMWGDAVNTASRMESHGEPGKIHISAEFKHAVETLHGMSLQFVERGEMAIKGKGMMKTYYLTQSN